MPARPGELLVIQVKCCRAGCDQTSEVRVSSLTLLIPLGWHFHADGDGKAYITCSDDCFDTWWAQRRWRRGKREMTELPVKEDALRR